MLNFKWLTNRNIFKHSLNVFKKQLFCEAKPFDNINSFLKQSDKDLHHIYDIIDTKELEEVDNITYIDGVLNISFKDKIHYVINIQRPNMQIWLSSPFSGPQRFEYDSTLNQWINIRNKKSLVSILEEEFNQLIKENKIKLI